MPSPHSEVGAKKFVHNVIPDGANRPEHDYYRTPACGTQALLKVERFKGLIWEPACGDGAISEELLSAGYQVRSSDLIDRGYGETGIDFLTGLALPVPNVVTNPPFTLIHEFAERALEVAESKVALLGRLLWLESKRRRAFFEATPLARVWVFSYRLNVARNGADYGDNGRGGMVAFAWYVWDKEHRGPPTLGWLAP